LRVFCPPEVSPNTKPGCEDPGLTSIEYPDHGSFYYPRSGWANYSDARVYYKTIYTYQQMKLTASFSNNKNAADL